MLENHVLEGKPNQILSHSDPFNSVFTFKTLIDTLTPYLQSYDDLCMS